MSEPSAATDDTRRQERIRQLIEQAENTPPLSPEEIERQRASITVEDAQGRIDTY